MAFFLGSIILVSIIVALLMAQLVVNVPFFDAFGPFSIGLLGVAGCFVLAYGAFFVLDPDPVSEFDAQVPLYMRTLPITGFSAFFWLPIYANTFNRLRRLRAEVNA